MESATVTSPALTRMGIIIGTAAYMKTEQARGNTSRQAIGHLGVRLRACPQMLAGSRAFDAGRSRRNACPS